MRRTLTLCTLLLLVCRAFAQPGAESKMPLLRNAQLESYVSQHPEKALPQHALMGKQGLADSSFPFVERFADSALSGLKWIDGNVTKVGRSVVFDALDALGAVYTGGSGQADVLTSVPLSLPAWNDLYIELTYSTGKTWVLVDSLVLQVMLPNGSWKNIWHSADTAVTRKIITLPVPSTLLSGSTQLRLINYTNFRASNREDFIVHSVIFTRKWQLPVYENLNGVPNDSFPSKIYWSHKTTRIKPGSTVGLPWGNIAVFDAIDENDSVYQQGNGQLGFADTLESHFIDLTQFALNDSVYLRFYYRAMPNATPGDSLVLEWKDSNGTWLRAAAFAGVPSASLSTFMRQVNIGALRGSQFQFRLINKCHYTAADTLKWIATGFHIGKKLLLPFVDDFSTVKVYPDQKLWRDRLVYVNNNFPIRPPSLNVATFDGLDRFGNAYGSGRGYCDTLTSWPINLSGLSRADSVYLSFFVQPMGNGEAPNSTDSFIVEMRSGAYDPAAYATTWGSVAAFPVNKFTQVFLLVDSQYLHDDFQFRFKNLGSRTGNLDHWHLDYVRLDKGRSRKDTNYFDIAISTTPTGLTKTYTSMPWDHFSASAYQTDTQYFYIRNNNNFNYAVNFNRDVTNQQPVTLDTYANVHPNLVQGTDTMLFVPKHVTLTPFTSGDTVLFRSRFTIKVGTAVDNIPSNDTIITETVFSNYFAYDDGSAEQGYAVKNYPGSVALGYTLSHPDSLCGVMAFFNQSSADVSHSAFNFMVWKSVGDPPAATKETLIKKIYPLQLPTYQGRINGFTYIEFQPHIPVDGKFYIGWEQSDKFELNIGLDQNYTINGQPGINPDMYYKTTDIPVWRPTELTGALMLRPIIGKWLKPPVGVSEVQRPGKENVLVYPNPASQYIHIEAEQATDLYIELLDMTGRQIMSQRLSGPETDLPQGLVNGMYVLKVLNTSNGTMTVKKIMINQ